MVVVSRMLTMTAYFSLVAMMTECALISSHLLWNIQPEDGIQGMARCSSLDLNLSLW
jgi:hypothetical protein